MQTPTSELSFFARLKLAFHVLGNSTLAQQVATLEAPPAITERPPEQVHAAGLAVLGLLQR